MYLVARYRARRVDAVGPLIALGGVLAGTSAAITALLRGGDTDAWVTVPVAAAVGLLIGLVACVIVKRTDPRIRTRADLDQIAAVPNLAVIPRHLLDAVRPDDVVMFRDPNSVDAEAYRALRTSFDFVTGAPRNSDGRGTVVLVTSARPGEGKSSVAANLAAACAMAGRWVTLVDGDLRKPQVHRLFRVGNTVGLSSLLAGRCTLGDAVQRVEGSNNLVVLAAGPPPVNPAELLANGQLAKVLDALADASDLVIVDAPPVLPVTDPTLISQHCDVVLLVATADVSTKRECAEALARLAVVGANVIGTVLLEPDDRVRAVPTYRYAPSAVPDNWWVAPDPMRPQAGHGGTGLRVVGGTDSDSTLLGEWNDDGHQVVADTEVAPDDDVSDDWSSRPPRH
jgi:receptor protein-tyrosine kinase